ncbi:MAG: hypothetical protein U0M02_10990 [Acutalibacteraceae bacterium]|nr:hypothetical protein [Acutalibacteraceae bacterium]
MGNGKMTSLFQNVKNHWNEPDREKGNYVPFKEYLTVFFGVGMNYSIKSPLEYLGFSASCFLIMYHYKLPYLAFSVITLIGLPLTYLWNVLNWFVNDNLGILEKKTEKKLLAFYGIVSFAGLCMILFDSSAFLPLSLVKVLNGINGVSARSFLKIFGIQLFVNAYGGLRNILWRKKLVPRYGRYKYVLFSNFVQKSAMIILIGWLPIYNVKLVEDRMWMAYLLFMVYDMFPFDNVIEQCTQNISPNPHERMLIRTWPVKLSHFVKNIFDVIIPIFGIAFSDIRFYKFVIPAVFIPMGALTLLSVRNISERIPQPPLEKKQKISLWYGISQVMKNKYNWLNTISTLLDSFGNGMISIVNVMYFFSFRMYTQCAIYGLMKTLMSFRSTPLSFVAPYFVRRFSYRSLKIIKLVICAVSAVAEMLTIMAFPTKQNLCGIVIFACEFFKGLATSIPDVADGDMGVRKNDYQMYLSGERLENFSGVFNWIISPVTTFVSLIIPVIILRNGFNSNWDVLYIDSARFNILAVPLIFDLIGFVMMIIPYLFWDFNNPQHEYVMEVLKQREKLAQEGYFPSEYEGGLNFIEPGELHAGIPVDSAAMIEKRNSLLANTEETLKEATAVEETI